MVHTWTPSKTNQLPLHNSHVPPPWEWGTYLQIMICLIVVVLKRQSAWWFHQQSYRTWKVFARWFLAPINCLNWQPLVGFARGKRRNGLQFPGMLIQILHNLQNNKLTNWWHQHEHEPTEQSICAKNHIPKWSKKWHIFEVFHCRSYCFSVKKSC